MSRIIDADKLITDMNTRAEEEYLEFRDIRNMVEYAPTITDQEIVKPLFDEFKEKLSKWLYHNSESVCGDNMIDIDYLEGHIDEILYEMGIIGGAEDEA